MNLAKIFGKPVARNILIEEIKQKENIEDIFERFKDKVDSNFLFNGTNQEFANYSLFGYEPFLTITSKGNRISIRIGEKKHTLTGNPFDILKTIVRTYKAVNPDPLLTSFCGGIGYLSYDLCRFTEKLPGKARDDLKLPDCHFVFYKNLYIHDKQKNRAWITSVDFLEKDNKRAAANAQAGIIKFRKLIKECCQKTGIEMHKPVKPGNGIKSGFRKQDYLKAVKKLRSYIYAGDIYQVNLSQRFNIDYTNHPYSLFRKLSRINPAPFSAYLNCGKYHIVSSSPERFLKVCNGTVETRPMKGTRPRGKNRKQDGILSSDLLKSEKDGAELSMIVDLERNDLGKTCEFGTVKVAEHKNLEIYSTVFQMTSTVTGKLKQRKDCIDVLKSCFPGGSITGCPKIRAMEIIDELEPTARGIYTGSIGYIGLDGSMDLNVVIRTIILKDGKAYFQVGGGIVADSVPENEYRETLDKAKAMVMALNN